MSTSTSVMGQVMSSLRSGHQHPFPFMINIWDYDFVTAVAHLLGGLKTMAEGGTCGKGRAWCTGAGTIRVGCNPSATGVLEER